MELAPNPRYNRGS